MEGLKCSGCKGCKWLLPNSFCGCPNNTEIGNDCYESEENSNTPSKIEDVKQEINDHINNKSKEEIENGINETESIFDELHKYLENATQEQLDKDWEELKQYNEVGPVIVDSCEAGYKWHEIADGDLPKEDGYVIAVYDVDDYIEGRRRVVHEVFYDVEQKEFSGLYEDELDVIAWMELPKYAKE